MDRTAEFCEDCMVHRHSFEYGIGLLNYDETARKSMAKIKYENKREYLDFYGNAMVIRHGNAIRRMDVDAIVPVPVHRSRLRKRGFNQAELFADRIGEKLNIPVVPEILIRTRKTMPQKELSAADRLKNLSGAFETGKIPNGIRRVLLVDDIYTTGSTAEACSRVLKAAGIEEVYVAVICMTGGRR